MRQLIGAVWAGSISAAICYAEYLGLGAMLGTTLLGYGDQSQAMGTLLVVLAASISCLVLAIRRLPVIAGPRGASLSVLVLGLMTLQIQFQVSRTDQLLLLATMMVGCTVMLLISTLRWVDWIFDRLPQWLVPAFIYASAVSIVASASRKYLHSCLIVNEWQAWSIFLGSTLAGLFWISICRKIAQKTPNPKLSRLTGSLAGTGLVVGAATCWIFYELSSLPNASAGMCARMGLLDLSLHSFLERILLLAQNGLQLQAAAPSLVLAAAWGMFVGLVVMLESRTAVASMADYLQKTTPAFVSQKLGQPLMLWNARLHAVLTSSTTVASSLSQSRSIIIWSLYRPSTLAIVFHIVALLLIALFASKWLAQLPQIALLVLMTLVGCSMLVPALEKTWREAYSLHHPGIGGGLGLWVVLSITAITQQPLAGFVLPAIFSVVTYARAKIAPKDEKTS